MKYIGGFQVAGSPGIKKRCLNVPQPSCGVQPGQFAQRSIEQAHGADLLAGDLGGPVGTAEEPLQQPMPMKPPRGVVSYSADTPSGELAPDGVDSPGAKEHGYEYTTAL